MLLTSPTKNTARAARERETDNSHEMPESSIAAAAPPARFADRLKFSEDGLGVRQPPTLKSAVNNVTRVSNVLGALRIQPNRSAQDSQESWERAQRSNKKAESAERSATESRQLQVESHGEARKLSKESAASVTEDPATSSRTADAPENPESAAVQTHNTEQSEVRPRPKLGTVIRTVRATVRFTNLVKFPQQHAFSAPQDGQVPRARAMEERPRSAEMQTHLLEEPSLFTGAAAAGTIQRMTRGKIARRETEAMGGPRARLEQLSEFPQSYSYASFEGGAWRGGAAVESATLTAQFDAGALNGAGALKRSHVESAKPFADPPRAMHFAVSPCAIVPANPRQKLRTVIRTVRATVRFTNLVKFPQQHAFSAPQDGQVPRARAMEERPRSAEMQTHLLEEPSLFTGAAAAGTIQRMTRGKIARRETEAMGGPRARLEQLSEFPQSYSYASFEGGAWHGGAAFESATLTAQFDAGAALIAQYDAAALKRATTFSDSPGAKLWVG